MLNDILDGIVFTKRGDTFVQSGELGTKHGYFQWYDGRWNGGWAVEPLEVLLARMNQSGPYKYSAYRILPAEKKELVIKPTCFGCGMIAGISCSINPLRDGRDFTKCDPLDPLVDFNEDGQFNVSFPVRTEGKNFGKHKPKTVWFNSVRCANLALLELTRTERKGRVAYDYGTQDLGEYRASQGWKRCPCMKLNNGKQFCDSFCESKHEGSIRHLLRIQKAVKESPLTGTYRGRCAYKPCGKGKDARGLRVRARVPRIGDFCSPECRKYHKEVTARKKTRPSDPPAALAA